MESWAAIIDAVKNSREAGDVREAFVSAALKTASEPIIRRVYKLEDVGQHRTWLDGRSKVLEDEIRTTFALAMSDQSATYTLATELPVLAAAYRLTGEDVFRRRVVEQLTEMTAWSPLQRPGWSCYVPGKRLPADGKDGNWLATGCGVRAIADTLDIMPVDAIDATLRIALDNVLAKEIADIVDDWKTDRSWFIKTNNPITNQWVLPTEGLMRACLVLGLDRYREAYELGVNNMLKSLDSHGRMGEFEEGFGYAAFTVTSMLHAARASAVAGDRRLVDHRFLKNFPTWIIHHLQPGRKIINAFDVSLYELPRDEQQDFRKLLSLMVLCTLSPVAKWALTSQFAGPELDLSGLACRAVLPVCPESAPSLYASYERATRVNWRDSWADDATGLWVRGGHQLDQHDHQDRGHVNFIFRGRPVLIEAGTPAYHNQLLDSHYSSGAGHNVLQLGTVVPDARLKTRPNAPPGWQKPGALAPITTRRLDDSGGDILVDGTDGYDRLAHWHRDVSWSSSELAVTDDVALLDGEQEIVLFRWHVAAEQPATIDGQGKCFTLSWPAAALTIEGSEPLTVWQELMPDNSLVPRDWNDDRPDHLHTCVIVRSALPVNRVRIDTHCKPRSMG